MAKAQAPAKAKASSISLAVTIRQFLEFSGLTRRLFWEDQRPSPSKGQTPEHICTCDNSTSPGTYKTFVEAAMRGPSPEPQQEPKARVCFHLGQIFKSCNVCNVQDWTVVSIASAKARAPGRAGGRSMVLS